MRLRAVDLILRAPPTPPEEPPPCTCTADVSGILTPSTMASLVACSVHWPPAHPSLRQVNRAPARGVRRHAELARSDAANEHRRRTLRLAATVAVLAVVIAAEQSGWLA